jgi:hypothetical protein
MSEPQRIRYRFDLPDGSQTFLAFTFDATDFRLANSPPAAPPFWADLKFNQCANCPLNAAEHPHCPAALQMASAIEPLKALVSFDTVGVTVTQETHDLRRNHGATRDELRARTDHGDCGLPLDRSFSPHGALSPTVRE